MKLWGTALVLVLALALGSTAFATGGQSDERRDLALARQATAKYHDVARAIADGYVPLSECVEAPGLGAMGIHYANFQLLSDPAVDAARPEMLLYVPAPNGSFRLVGLEYYLTDADQDLATNADLPSLFGRPFDGPMPGHGPGQPVHYDLHVWTWQANPAGMFAEFNPNLSC